MSQDGPSHTRCHDMGVLSSGRIYWAGNSCRLNTIKLCILNFKTGVRQSYVSIRRRFWHTGGYSPYGLSILAYCVHGFYCSTGMAADIFSASCEGPASHIAANDCAWLGCRADVHHGGLQLWRSHGKPFHTWPFRGWLPTTPRCPD